MNTDVNSTAVDGVDSNKMINDQLINEKSLDPKSQELLAYITKRKVTDGESTFFRESDDGLVVVGAEESAIGAWKPQELFAALENLWQAGKIDLLAQGLIPDYDIQDPDWDFGANPTEVPNFSEFIRRKGPDERQYVHTRIDEVNVALAGCGKTHSKPLGK